MTIHRRDVDTRLIPTPEGERVFAHNEDEQPYRVLIEAMTEGALVLSLDGTILYCNSRFATMVGSSLQKVIGHTLPDMIAPADHARLTALLDMNAPEPARAELTLLRPGGGAMPVHISTRTMQIGDRSSICAVITDVTEVEAAMEPRLHLAAIVELSTDAIVSVNSGGVILTWNRGAERLFGYSAKEAIGQSIHLITPLEGHAGLEQSPEEVGRGVITEGLETVRIRKDGRQIDVSLALSPMRDRLGRISRTCIIYRDISVRRRAQERLQSVLESAPDAIVVANRKSRIVLVNSQAESMFGRNREQLIGRRVEILIPERHRERHQGYFRGYYRERASVASTSAVRELTGVRADGTEFPVEVTLSPVETEEDLLICASVRDVTDRYVFQETLREKNHQLEAALQAKDRFLAAMSHELRTPLTAIIGFTGILLMKIPGPINEAQQRQLGLVQSSAKHLLAIINDLLDLSRIESGNMEPNLKPVNAAEVLEEVAHTVHPLAEQNNLQLDLLAGPPSVILVTDRRLLSQILINLVSNAVKFTEKGAVRLSLESHGNNGHRAIRFVVADTGIGIRAEDQAKLFKEFSRVGEKATCREEGSGLGLYLSQRMASLLGGRITVESEYGKGSTFTLTMNSSPAAAS
ncbi:MAG: PAS domain S-box protein, partial [Bryobacteraceae bacterium]